MANTATLPVERHVLDSLMADLVGHDRRPSAYLLYLALFRLSYPRDDVSLSLQALATETGLSKTAVQLAVSHLVRRNLLELHVTGPTVPHRYRVLRPWVPRASDGAAP